MRKTYALALVAALAAGPALAEPVTLADRDMDQVTAGGILQDILNALFPPPIPVTPPANDVKTDKKTGAAGNSTATSTSTTTVPKGSSATTTRNSTVTVLPGLSQGLSFSSINF